MTSNDGDAPHRTPRGSMLSRRQLIRRSLAAAGAALAGTAAMPALAAAAQLSPGNLFVLPARVQPPAAGSDPKPILGGRKPKSVPGADLIHLYPPYEGDPSTITDFSGYVGVFKVEGTGNGTDPSTGETAELPFRAELRFMKGAYRGVDGQVYPGCFGFVALDVMDGNDPPTQLHAYSPGLARSGLFRTLAIPGESVEVDLEQQTAALRLSQLALRDDRNLSGTLRGGLAPQATVSIDLRWAGGPRKAVPMHDLWEQFYAADIVEMGATLAWSARQDGFQFVSNPTTPDDGPVAFIGHERNGYVAGARGAFPIPAAFRPDNPEHAIKLDTTYSGRLPGASNGRYVYYKFPYEGGFVPYRVNMQAYPDNGRVFESAGFRIYGPQKGKVYVVGGFQAGKSPNVTADLAVEEKGDFVVQVFNANANPPVTIDYDLWYDVKPPPADY